MAPLTPKYSYDQQFTLYNLQSIRFHFHAR